MGDRMVEIIGSNVYEDYTNNRRAVVIMNTLSTEGIINRKTTGSVAGFTGLLYDCNQPLVDSTETIKKHFSREDNSYTKLDKLTDVGIPLCQIEGNW